MKILYIAPENTVGTLNLWKSIHEARGNECLYLTLFPARGQFDPGVCLDLPLVSSNSLYIRGRHKYYQRTRGILGDYQEKDGYPPVWEPHTGFERTYFQFRDWLWHFKIEAAIETLNLRNYDIYHLEWGLEFYRDARFVKELNSNGKHIACTYHGQDLRTRGVIPAIDSIAGLNITSELDLLKRHPDMKYIFLPFDTSRFAPSFSLGDPIRICHSPTNRYYKGSEHIIPVCEQLAEEENVEFILLENQPYEEVQRIKQTCDILVDQVYNRGGWGYGMNSVEALSMGLCCVTELIPEYQSFIPDHPFVNVTGDTLYNGLKDLIKDPEKITEYCRRGREWVIKYHGLKNTGDTLYNYYRELGWL